MCSSYMVLLDVQRLRFGVTVKYTRIKMYVVYYDSRLCPSDCKTLYEDVKEVVKLALTSEDEKGVNMIFIGPAASAKTLFLKPIKSYAGSKGLYFDATNTTNRILSELELKPPRIICLDELEKMPRNFQEKMLSFLESGEVKVDQQRLQLDFEIKGLKVFAAVNDVTRVTKSLLSRFRIPIYLERYTQDQFVQATCKLLHRLPPQLATFIGNHVYEHGGDIRKVVGVGQLIRKAYTRESSANPRDSRQVFVVSWE